MNLALACGILAQLPMVTMLLTAIGLVTPGFLLRQWRYALVAVFLLTALITPGDVVSAQLVMGVPMVALYFLSVGNQKEQTVIDFIVTGILFVTVFLIIQFNSPFQGRLRVTPQAFERIAAQAAPVLPAR